MEDENGKEFTIDGEAEDPPDDQEEKEEETHTHMREGVNYK
jgi:hypothetical protein